VLHGCAAVFLTPSCTYICAGVVIQCYQFSRSHKKEELISKATGLVPLPLLVPVLVPPPLLLPPPLPPCQQSAASAANFDPNARAMALSHCLL
tara:strand:+ start:2253 stop:2531 length:279 start_codon:yes stop_codon:yes gene_type:complete